MSDFSNTGHSWVYDLIGQRLEHRSEKEADSLRETLADYGDEPTINSPLPVLKKCLDSLQKRCELFLSKRF